VRGLPAASQRALRRASWVQPEIFRRIDRLDLTGSVNLVSNDLAAAARTLS
jgi:hypothetical protein